MKVYQELKTGQDGKLYGVRYLLEPSELAGLQAAGLVGYAGEIIGMAQVAEVVLADFEKQAFTSFGGLIQ